MKTILFAALALSFYSLSSFASDAADPRMGIVKVEFKEVVPTAEELYLTQDEVLSNMNTESMAVDLGGIGDGIRDAIGGSEVNIVVDQVIRIGRQVIDIIKAGAPVINIKTDAVHVVPKGIQAWQQLSGWQAPMLRVYLLSMTNGFGMEVIHARLKLSASYGGSYNGRGQFLSNVYMVPTELSALWGYYLDVWTENHDPINTGSKKNPVAGLGVDLHYKVTTAVPLKEATGTQDYFIKGSGSLDALANE